MSGTGYVEHDFGGEPHRFLIRYGQLRKIQEASGAGPAEVARRLGRCIAVRAAFPDAPIPELVNGGLGDWRIEDVREPVFQGLIAAGMAPNEAGKLVREWIEDRGFKGLVENAELAYVLIVAGWAEPEDDPVGEPRPGTKAPAAKSRSRPSTASVGSSG